MNARFKHYTTQFKPYAIMTLGHFKTSALFQKAAQLTLSSLLAAVPIITIILGILSFTPTLQTMQDQLLNFIELHLAPGSSEQVLPYLVKFSEQSKKLPIAGIIMLFLTALLLLNNFEASVQSIWHIQKRRKIRERMLTYWAILTLGPILFAATLSLYGTLISLEFQQESNSAGFNNLLEFGSLVLYFLMLLTLNYLTPNAEVSFKLACLASIFGSLGLFILNIIFSSFAQFFTNYQIIYGAFAALPVFLIWLQTSWLIILASICLCATLHKIKT
ncbi:YihY family inner membrane protein [Marinomonas sp. THO17]|uniref:YihY family inner membrane protein n=1 Tax=Marinomonas sp. THO17 TaxID=3149048 RepID=UPI00336BE8A5